MKSLIKKDWFVGLVITLLFLIAVEIDLFSALDRKAYNLGLQFSSNTDPHEEVVVVAIDDKSIQALGAWPWPRDVLAETTLLLNRVAPQVIGYNLALDSGQNKSGLTSLVELRKVLERERKLSTNVNKALRIAETTQRGDDKLAAAFKAGGRIVLGMPYTTGVEKPTGLSQELPIWMERFALDKVSVNNASRGIGWPTPGVTRASEVFPPILKFARQVGGVGSIASGNVFDGDPLVVQYGSEVMPSFALMMVARSKGLSAENIESRASISPELDGKSLGADVELLIYPRYYEGEGDKPAFPVFSFIDILEGNVDLERLRDKLVIIGLTSPRLAPAIATPAGDTISPALASAHTISSLLNNEQYRLPEWAIWAQRGLVLVMGLYLMLVIGRFRTNTAFFLSLFLVLMVFNAHFLLMSIQSMWLPMMAAVVMVMFGHLVLGTRQWINLHLQSARNEVSAANRQVGVALHGQGFLDQAFEKFRHCRIDDSLLGQVYNLGLDYERKRQFNKAGAVYKFILQHSPEYNDVSERLAQNEQAANTVVLAGADSNGPGANLISSQNGVQKPKLGRYQIDSEIGRGAMGMVYLGHDDKIGRTVAIKTMMLSDDIEEEFRDEVRTRFFREAEAAGRLDHPNIVTVYDVGEEQDLAYIAMDYLAGKDLTAYTSSKTLLPVSQVFGIISNIAMALDYAHRQHVVHRDIKPANIIYDQKKGIAKVTDFGVACLTDASATKTGTVLGSPYYMSPEQLAGKKVDGRADLFSLGVTLYQMLSGALPFNGDSIANLMYNIANEDHPDIRRFRSDLPNCVQKLVDKALQKDVAERFQSGKDLVLAMKRCQEHIREMEAA